MRLVALAALAALIAAPAFAAPHDCTTGPIADHPVSGTVNGKPFKPNKVTFHINKDGMESGDAKFDRYDLSIQTDGIFNEATVDMLVPLNKKPDGRTFRVLPVDSIGAQPAAANGIPEVQGWEIQLEAAGVDVSFTDGTAAIRVEWGARKGDTLAGKIHFCVPSVKADIEGSFVAKEE
jgi:hypothetical protein